MEKEPLRFRELPEDIRECILEGESYKAKGLDILARGEWINNSRTILFSYDERLWKIDVIKDDRPRYPGENRYYTIGMQEVSDEELKQKHLLWLKKI